MYDGIQYRDDALPDGTKWGDTGKHSDLTAEEIDNNFWEIYSRMKDLEDNPPTAVSISNILVDGSQMTIQLSNGGSFGPFTLPIATFELRGEFVAGTEYHELDVITVAHVGVFLVRLDHTGVDPFDPLREIGSEQVYLPIYGFDATIYDIGFFYPGKPGIGIDDGAAIMGHSPDRAITLPVDLEGSVATLQTGPAAPMEFIIKKDAVDIGSVNFGIGETVGTFTFADDISFDPGQVLRIMKPTGGIDSAARELSLTIAATQA